MSQAKMLMLSAALALLSVVDASDPHDLFARNFDLACLDGVDRNATRDAEAFFLDNIRELRWDSNGLAMLYFIGLVTSMQLGRLPDPRKGCVSFMMFLVWCLLQLLITVSQLFGLIFVVASYVAMKESYGECLRGWNGKGGFALLDITTALTVLWQPSVLSRVLSLEVGLLTTLDGLNVVKLDRLFKLVNYGLKLPLDLLLSFLASFSIAIWLLTLAWLFALPLLGIPVAMFLALRASLGIVGAVMQQWPLCVKCGKGCWRRVGDLHKHCFPPEAAESKTSLAAPEARLATPEENPPMTPQEGTEKKVEDGGEVLQAARWLESGRELPKSRRDALETLRLTRIAVPRLAYLGLISMAAAPSLVTSTFLAWHVYGGDSDGALTCLYDFSFLSFLEGIGWPSLVDVTELLSALDPDALLETLVSLGRIELELPQLLLQRSRTWSAFAAIVSFLKSATSALEKLLEFALLKAPSVSLKDAQHPKMLKKRGYNWRQMLAMSCAEKDMKEAGATIKELEEAGSTLSELKEAEFTAQEWTEAGHSLQKLHEAGYTFGQLKQAGYSAKDIRENLVISFSEAALTAKDLAEAGYSAENLKEAGYSAQELMAHFTAEELKEAQFSAKHIAMAGFTLLQLREAKFTAQQLKEAGHNLRELHEAGYSAQDLKQASFSAKDLKAYYSLEVLREVFSEDELAEAGITESQLVQAAQPAPGEAGSIAGNVAEVKSTAHEEVQPEQRSILEQAGDLAKKWGVKLWWG